MAAEIEVKEGEVLAGKYRIDKVLGVGGMGVVVAAYHLELEQRVAIKFLLRETLSNPEAVARFAREARAAVRIRSEHVARVSDVGKLENGAPYMVMEYLEGGDLAAWLSQRGALPSEQAVEFVLQACEAIAEAHTLGIVHRDLKPANLFVIRRPDGTPSVKVLDFGISKMANGVGPGSGSMTSTTALMGSPLYMPPEQMESSKDVDARGDIWALGAILYEFLAGDTPFGGATMPEVILQVMTKPVPPLRARRPDVPPGLEAVIVRCLEKDRARRFQSIGELAIELLPFAPRRAKASVDRISGMLNSNTMADGSFAMAPPASEASRTAVSWGQTSSGSKRSPWLLLAALGSLVIGVGLVGAWVKHSNKATELGTASANAGSSALPPVSATTTATAPLEPPPEALPTASAHAEPSTAPSASAAPAASASTSPSGVTPIVPRLPQPFRPNKPPKPTDEWGNGRL